MKIRALHVTQPTLSRQMMDLEADVGKILFIRGKRRQSLCFRPFSPGLTVDVHVVWKKYQVFSTAARKFLEQLQVNFGAQSL